MSRASTREYFEGYQIIEPTLEFEIPIDRPVNTRRFRRALRKRGPTRVLLAENDLDTADYIEHLLNSAGVSVTRARDGEEALDFAMMASKQKREFDVVILDLQLPKLDGYATAATLRYRGYQSPIIAMTGHPLNEDLRAYREAGCDHFMVKSQVPERLMNLIKRCIS